MNRSTTLALAGLILLTTSAAVPLAGLATAQWDTDYVYSVQTGDSYCVDIVHSPEIEEGDDFQVDYGNLSATGRQHFERALADGRYVVEDRSATASDFQFTDDHVAAGEGCYAVNYEGETHALRTSIESQRVGPMTGHWPIIVGGLLLVLGIGSLLVGVGLAVRRRLA
jgi:hypothetical protein